jgi:type IV pilus assembly protein PilO
MALTLDDIKKLSPKAKAAIIVAVIVVVGYFDWFYFLSAAVEKRTTLNQKLEELQDQVKEKEKNVKQFDKYKADVAALRDNYNVALQKLPAQREIPGLFHSVALAGKDTGIDFLLFEPKAAVAKTKDKQEQKLSASLKPSDQRQADPKKATDTKGDSKGDSKKPPEPE